MTNKYDKNRNLNDGGRQYFRNDFHGDNTEYYPTPTELIEKLLTKELDIYGFEGEKFPVSLGKTVLEPSAGGGAIIEYIKDNDMAKEVDAIEYDVRLSNELTRKGHTVIYNDFLTFEPFKQYDSIVMNPPFSNGDEHVLKALEVAESNITKPCTIYAIVNAETIRNPYSNRRKTLVGKLEAYGAEIEYVSEGFTKAERKTDVEVALITVKVSPIDDSKRIYEQILEDVEADKEDSPVYELSTQVNNNEVGELLADIPRLIEEYQQLVDIVKESHEVNAERERLIAYVEKVNDVDFYLSEPTSELDSDLEKLRAKYWRMILQTEKFADKLTTEAREQLLRSTELVQDLDITEDNVRMIFGALLANFGDMVESSIISMFEMITDHSQRGDYNGNIHLYNGWYTNDAYKINNRIIYPVSYNALSDLEMGIGVGGKPQEYGNLPFKVRDFIGDLNKAFEVFTPVTKFENIGISEYENNVMKFRIYRKGTVHVTFKDLETLDLINITAGRHFNWLPTEYDVENDKEAADYIRKNFSGKLLT